MTSKYSILRRITLSMIMVIVIVSLVYFFGSPTRYVFSGDFLESRFRLPSELSGDSYQSGICRMLICAIILLVYAIPIVLITRLLTHQSNPIEKWSHILFSSAVLIFPLCTLIIAYHMLFQYIQAMGVTFRRMQGVSLSTLLLLALIATWLWSSGLLDRKPHKLPIPKRTRGNPIDIESDGDYHNPIMHNSTQRE